MFRWMDSYGLLRDAVRNRLGTETGYLLNRLVIAAPQVRIYDVIAACHVLSLSCVDDEAIAQRRKSCDGLVDLAGSMGYGIDLGDVSLAIPAWEALLNHLETRAVIHPQNASLKMLVTMTKREIAEMRHAV